MIEEKTRKHPCYSKDAHEYSRMHVPVAPKCNIQCNYCSRKYDCQNESRPGVTSQILSPEEALEKYAHVKEKIDKLSVLGIAGPGDALANIEETRKTISLIKEYDPSVTLCLSTNGLLLPQYAPLLVELGVYHITITINTIRPETGAKIYKYVTLDNKKYIGIEAAEILLENQLKGLEYLSRHNVVCKVNFVYMKGINDYEVKEVVEAVSHRKAFITNIMPHIPTKGTEFAHLSKASLQEIDGVRDECQSILPQMYHCNQCRADAIGKLTGRTHCVKKQIG